MWNSKLGSRVGWTAGQGRVTATTKGWAARVLWEHRDRGRQEEPLLESQATGARLTHQQRPAQSQEAASPETGERPSPIPDLSP